MEGRIIFPDVDKAEPDELIIDDLGRFVFDRIEKQRARIAEWRWPIPVPEPIFRLTKKAAPFKNVAWLRRAEKKSGS